METEMLEHQLKTLLMVSLALASAACGGDSTSPPSAIVGTYTAIQWQTTGNSGSTNQLVIGSTLQISLSADGSTSGHMHVAASNGQPATDFDLAGHWTASGSTVDFTQVEDNFLADMIFTLDPISNDAWDLVGDASFPGSRVELRLRRTP
jgi:hypothetical protein